MRRRPFLLGLLGTMAATPLLSRIGDVSAQDQSRLPRYSGPILDAHIHLFDPDRPEGIPWPPKTDLIYGRALPDRYFNLSSGFGVTGAIAVEASNRREDNFWLLDTVRANSRMVGFVGNLAIGEKTFAADFARLEKEPLFLGSRDGNLWDRDLGKALQSSVFIADLKQLARAGRTLDSANPNPKLIVDLLRLTDKVPELRIVADHMPNAEVTATEALAYARDLAELAGRPQVFMKLSEIPRRAADAVVNAPVRFDLPYHRARLDELWALFGEDRTVFGSDWPNSDHLGPLAPTINLARDYMATQSAEAQRKVFFDNSRKAYRWVARREEQQAVG